MIKLPITNEIVSCLISSGITPENLEILRSSPKGFLEALLRTQLSAELNVCMVENTDEVIHLGLPYYAQVDEMRRLRNSYFLRLMNRLKNFFIFVKARSHA